MSVQYISKNINNYDYAPGIATYGGQGLPGKTGEPGNCIFFTSFNILSGEDLQDLKNALRENRLPVKNGQIVSRTFQNGDYFFDTSGNIFLLHDIDKFLSYPITSDNYNVYFTLVGKIKSTTDANVLFSQINTTGTNRVSLNQEYTGLDINTTKQSFNEKTDVYAMRVYADNTTNTDGNINVLHMSGFYNYDTQSDLMIYYDPDLNVWHITSECNGKQVPVVIDAEVIVNRDATENLLLDDYSSVITTSTPITSFYNIAKQITYTWNKKKLTLSNGNLIPESLRDYVRAKFVICDKSGTVTHQYITKYKNLLDNKLDFLSNIAGLSISSLSLICDVEVYLKGTEISQYSGNFIYKPVVLM